MTAEILRPWDPPVSVQKTLRRVSGRAGSGGQPGDAPAVGVLEVNGRYNCADVLVQAPAAWENALVIATVINGGTNSVVADARTVGGIQDRPSGYTPGFRGLLFSIRARPFSKLAIEVVPLATDLPPATFSANAWGGPNAVQSDRAGRQTVDLYARNDQQFVFSDVIVGGPTTIVAANPSGGRLAITNLSWTQDGAGAVSVQGDGGTIVYQGRQAAAGAFTPPPFVQPLFLPRGEALQATTAAAGTILNVVGFRE